MNQADEHPDALEALYLETWEKLSNSAPAETPPMSLRKAQRRWWWIMSKEKFQSFYHSPEAQGYELLRRVPKFASEMFFIDNHDKTWLELSPPTQSRFRLEYRSILEKFGFQTPRVQVWIEATADTSDKTDVFDGLKQEWVPRTPKPPRVQVVFDCRVSSNSLIESLERALKQPDAFAVGTYVSKEKGDRDSRVFGELEQRWVTRGPKKPRPWDLFPPSQKVSELPIVSPTRRPTWRTGNATFEIVLEWPSEALKNCQNRLGDKLLTSFKSFVKDKPPLDFRMHRKKYRKEASAADSAPNCQSYGPSPRTLGRIVMLLDFPEIPTLARWLYRRSEARECLKLPNDLRRIQGSLRNARKSLLKMLFSLRSDSEPKH